jgi:SAM-dependent methyltransferase
MYSAEWFETFAATVPAQIVEQEIGALAGILPIEHFRRVLDVGCGIGRITAPLVSRGYAVTGLDISLAALRSAKRRAPAALYIALDQQHIGRMRWRFDGALFMWNSLGLAGLHADLEMLSGVASILRGGGRAIFDSYHPEWLRQNERSGAPDRGAISVRRWMQGNRCCHEIRYESGRIDDIQFDVYAPEQMGEMCRRANLEPIKEMAWWDASAGPSANAPRYQLICERPG